MDEEYNGKLGPGRVKARNWAGNCWLNVGAPFTTLTRHWTNMTVGNKTNWQFGGPMAHSCRLRLVTWAYQAQIPAGYLSPCLCIYSTPNCSKAWSVQCGLWSCALWRTLGVIRTKSIIFLASGFLLSRYCLNVLKIHPWRQSIVKTVDSDLRICCYFVLVRSAQYTGLTIKTACLIFHGLAILTMKLMFSISNLGTSEHILCILSRRKNYIAPRTFGSTSLSNLIRSFYLTESDVKQYTYNWQFS